MPMRRYRGKTCLILRGAKLGWSMSELVYDEIGYCPICEESQRFQAESYWYRDALFCSGCGSVPRERALALVMQRVRPDWRNRRIHECSPINRGISLKMSNECTNYIATQFIPNKPLGAIVDGFRNENLECTTFGDRAFDLILSLDVMEHVNDPESCFIDMHGTLDVGGFCIFTAPTEKDKVHSERVARYLADGSEEHYAPPEYHGNPVNDKGALVTFRYGYEFANEIAKFAPFDVTVHRYSSKLYGIFGEYTEVYECRKRSSDVFTYPNR